MGPAWAGLCCFGDRGAAATLSRSQQALERAARRGTHHGVSEAGPKRMRARLDERLCKTSPACGLARDGGPVRLRRGHFVMVVWSSQGRGCWVEPRPCTYRLRGPIKTALFDARCCCDSPTFLVPLPSPITAALDTQGALPAPPPCTRYQPSPARPGTAGRRWLPPPASRFRGPTTSCPSQPRSSAHRRRRVPRP
jgi:hypothetical protein